MDRQHKIFIIHTTAIGVKHGIAIFDECIINEEIFNWLGYHGFIDEIHKHKNVVYAHISVENKKKLEEYDRQFIWNERVIEYEI